MDRFCSLVSRLQDVDHDSELVVKMWSRWFFESVVGMVLQRTDQVLFSFKVVVVLLCISSYFIHFKFGVLYKYIHKVDGGVILSNTQYIVYL